MQELILDGKIIETFTPTIFMAIRADRVTPGRFWLDPASSASTLIEAQDVADFRAAVVSPEDIEAHENPELDGLEWADVYPVVGFVIFKSNFDTNDYKQGLMIAGVQWEGDDA